MTASPTRPAPTSSALGALIAMELRLAARRSENLLVTIVIPAAVLLFFASTSVLMIPGRPVDFLLPGSIALALIATGLVSLGIATAYERHYGVLKRLGGAPIPAWAVLSAKGAAVLAVEAVQVVLLVAIAAALLGWRPGTGWSPPLVVAALALGTVAFTALGLALAGALRAEATLAVANGLFLAFLLLGGIVLPLSHLPGPLAALAGVLPAAPLSEVLRLGLGAPIAGDGGGPFGAAGPLLVLAIWAIVAVVAAVRAFRWE